MKALHRLCHSGALMVAILAIAACDDTQSETALKQGLPLPSEVHENEGSLLKRQKLMRCLPSSQEQVGGTRSFLM